ncbi:hypothetical protein C1646_822314 [Rhizophagus diaphanus]|nr:hypothetical protein C1646_822314 [Rhizophagus diaphanus] [Rhizophagus sp. MUCL 43196]
MPTKLSTVCYHETTEHLTQEFTVKKVTVVIRLDDTDPTKVVYLKVKIFIPFDENIPTQIEDFEKGDVVFLRVLDFYVEENLGGDRQELPLVQKNGKYFFRKCWVRVVVKASDGCGNNSGIRIRLIFDF